MFLLNKQKNKDQHTPTPDLAIHKLDWLESVSIVFCLWLAFYPHPYKLVFTIVLLLPIVGLILNGLSRPSLASLVSISNQNGKNKYDIADFLEFPGIFIVLRVILDYDFESIYSIVKVAIIWFVILLVLLFLTHKRIESSNKNRSVIYISIICNIALYSYGATYGINCIYDNSSPKVYRSKVVDKSHSGSKHRMYYLKVKPWGKFHETVEISVSQQKYASTDIGQEVSIDYKEGLLGIPWHFVE